MSGNEIDKLFKYMQTEFSKVHDSVGSLGERVDRLANDVNLVQAEQSVIRDDMQAGFESVNTRLEKHEERMDRRFDEAEEVLNEIQNAVGQELADVDGQLTLHGSWIAQLAAKTDTILDPQQ